MKKRVLLVGDVAGAYRSQILIRTLLDYRPNNGYDVAMVTSGFYASRLMSKTLPAKLWRRVMHAIARLFSVLELMVKLPFADVVYILPMNHRQILRVCFANLIWRKPVITDLYISLYDTGLDRKWFANEASLRAKYFRLLDKMIIERSNKVIHVTQTELEYIATLVGAKLERNNVAIIPLAVDERRIAKPSKSTTFRICWWGTFIPLHGLENIINAMKILAANTVKIKLALFGVPGSAGDPFKELVAELNLASHVTIHTNKSFSNGLLEEHLANECDLALGNFGNSTKAKMVIVNKIIDAFAMQLPVLTMTASILKEFIDTETEIFTCGNNPESIANAIQRIMENQEERQKRAKAGYQRYLQTFTPQRYEKSVLAVLEEATSQSRRII